jgi:hypothetical protein
MWGYVVLLVFSVVLFGFVWLLGFKVTFAAQIHINLKRIPHFSRSAPAHLPPHRGTMERDLRWVSGVSMIRSTHSLIFMPDLGSL